MRKMAVQSLKEMDAEQTCQEMLALSPKQTNINHPRAHSHLFSPPLSLWILLLCLATHSRSRPLCFLTAAFILFWPSLQPLALDFFYDWPKNINTGSNFTRTPGLFIHLTVCFINPPSSKFLTLLAVSLQTLPKKGKDKSIAYVWKEGLTE